MRNIKVDSGILPQCYIKDKVKCRDRKQIKAKFRDGNYKYIYICENGRDEELHDCPHDKDHDRNNDI